MTAAAALGAMLLQPVAASAATQLAASPSSLSFSATAGGANPPRQNVNLTSSDGTAAGFTVGADQPWVVIASVSSATTPATVSLGVNTSGLAAGTYTGAVTIGSQSKTVLGTTVSITLTVTAPSPELIVNGGFEGSITPWVIGGVAQRTGAAPLDGTAHLRIAGTGTAYQQFTIPSTAQAADLDFYLRIQTDETTTTTQYDTLKVEIRNSSGGLLATPATYNNLDPARNTSGNVANYARRSGISLLAYKGQTVRLQFSALNSPTLLTTFDIDTVSVSTRYTAPTLSVSPSSLSFFGSAFGGDPQPQNVSISNTGSNPLSWSASDNQTWMSVTPSGTTPTGVTVTVSTAGLAVGNYSGTITVSATGASNSPVTVGVAFSVAAPEYVSVGTFYNDTGWVRSGQSYWGLYGASQGTSPSAGGYSYLGSSNLASGLLYQNVTIPSAATTANLTFYLQIFSNETATAGPYDKLFVEVTNTAGTVLATLATYSNLDENFSFVRKGAFNMIAFKGQTVRLQFRATTDGSNSTKFMIDDVSVR